MQITTMRQYFTPTKMTIIKRWTVTRIGEDVEKLEPFCVVGEAVIIVQPLWKTVWWFLKKKKKNRINCMSQQFQFWSHTPKN